MNGEMITNLLHPWLSLKSCAIAQFRHYGTVVLRFNQKFTMLLVRERTTGHPPKLSLKPCRSNWAQAVNVFVRGATGERSTSTSYLPQAKPQIVQLSLDTTMVLKP